MVTRIPRYRQAKETKCGEMDGREPERLILPRQPRSAQILTADSVQQQPIAAPEGSEINHGIHRNTRKRESESTSPFRVLPGGNSRPQGGVVPWLRVCDDLSCRGNIHPPKSVTVSNSRIGSDGVSGHEPGTNRGLCLLTLSDYSKLKIESLRATGTSRTDSIWGISDRNSLGVSKGRSFHVPEESRLRLLRDRGGPGAGACGGGR